MKAIALIMSVLLLMPFSVPVRADFQYTETSKVTGGALVGMAKFAAALSKSSEKDMLKPTTVSRYVKGNKLRTDNEDGTIRIIDLDGRRIIGIDPQKKQYGVVTFDQMKAALEQQKQKMQEALQQAQQQQKAPKQDVQLNVTPTFKVEPATGTRMILGQPTVESKIEMDMLMQAQGTGVAAPSTPAPGTGTNSATMTMNFDIFAAPTLTGYQEFSKFYQRMAKEINWMPPANIHVDPRMSQGMAELQKNGDVLKGLPMLTIVKMGMAMPPGQASADTAQNTAQNPPAASPQSSGSNSPDLGPTSVKGAVAKGLGGLFGKKKQPDNSQSAPSTGGAQAGQPGSSSLMEMTTEVTSFSVGPLESSLFDIPAGYTQVQINPEQMLNAKAKQ